MNKFIRVHELNGRSQGIRYQEAMAEVMREEHIEYYKDGSVKAKGLFVDGKLDGYWEWFRKDGSKMRSGHFKAGEQTGEWITYDRQCQVYKVTNMAKHR
jgi:antitoxin component YwqK of YwqJK toxin-antitoxin module